MEQMYCFLDAFFNPGILVGMAVCFLCLHIPQRPALRNYRVAHYVMGAAYTAYALSIALEYHLPAGSTGTLLGLVFAKRYYTGAVGAV